LAEEDERKFVSIVDGLRPACSRDEGHSCTGRSEYVAWAEDDLLGHRARSQPSKWKMSDSQSHSSLIHIDPFASRTEWRSTPSRRQG
jgi:hypothetical protein